MQTFTLIYTVLGGLGIFFYGMKSMSDALQAVAGDVIRDAIGIITKNRVLGVIVGVLVTVLVQSSTVTTVMTVGLVNAGLMTLTQAIGVIFGANIGTTITGWIISIKVGKYGLLLIGAGIFPLLFAKNNKTRQIGRALFGIGMIFFGLMIMTDGFRPLRDMPEFLNAISYFSEQTYAAYFASVIVGCVLTMIIQSSSGMLGITIAMAMTGVIPFHTAAALVLGENIGTTITAFLASIGGNRNARRAALAHTIFNCLGVIALFSIFPFYISFIEWFVPGDVNAVNSSGEYINVAVHIASGHSIFNITATLLFLPFVRQLQSVVTWLVPDKSVKEQHHLVMLGDPQDSIPATGLTLVKAEIDKMKGIVDKMYLIARNHMTDENSSKSTVLAKLRDYEQITDNIQKEIMLYLVKLQQRRLTEEQSMESQAFMQIADELESIADYIEKLVFYSTKNKPQELFINEAKEDFFHFFDQVESYYHEVAGCISSTQIIDLNHINRKSEQLRLNAESIRERHLIRVAAGDYAPLTALTFSDMIVALRKIRSHTKHLADAYIKIQD